MKMSLRRQTKLLQSFLCFTSFLLLIVLLANQGYAQNYRKLKYRWTDKPKVKEVSEKYKNEDAYVIKKRISHSYSFEYGMSFTASAVRSVQKRIKILTKAGLERFANLVINMEPGYEITILDVRTIKVNGKIVGIDDEDIQFKDYTSPYSGKRYVQARIALKNVEVGDEIEYIYGLSDNRLSGTQNVFFHEELPCETVRYTLSIKRGLVTKVYNLNGLGSPDHKVLNKDIEVFKWRLDDVPGVENDAWSIKELELPHVSYYLQQIYLRPNPPYWISEEKWEDIYDSYGRVFNDNRKTRDFDQLMANLESKLGGESKLQRFKNIVNYINENFEVLSRLPESEQFIAYADYFQNKRIDEVNLTTFYETVLTELQIPFEYLFTRNRYGGPLRLNMINAGQITDVGFIFQDENGKDHFIFPATSSFKFFVDEIPFYLQGAKAVIIKKTGSRAKEVEARFGTISSYPREANKIKQDISAELDLAENRIDFRMRLTMSGVIAGALRDNIGYGLEQKDMEELEEILFNEEIDSRKIDSIYVLQDSDEVPFNFVLNVEFHQDSVIRTVEEGTYSLMLDDLFYHNVIETSSLPRLLDLHPMGEYEEQINFFIKPGISVNFVNADEIGSSVTLDAGKSIVEVKNKTTDQLLLSSYYSIDKSVISKDDYQQLVQLEETYKRSRSVNLLMVQTE